MHEPSMKQWSELYEIGKKIKKAAPWKHLWDEEIITIMLPEHEETVYCSVMGRGGECYAIGLYVGNKGLKSYYNILKNADDEHGEISLTAGLDQNCLLCNFGDREELTPKDRKILKELNISFRGRNEWIYFRSMSPGHYPWYINADEAEILIQTLQNLIPACECLNDRNITVNFSKGETLIRRYSSEKNEWFNESGNLPTELYEEIMEVVIDDEELIELLTKQKKSSFKVEFDIMYLPMPVQENKDEAPYFPKMVLIVDPKKGQVLSQNLLKDTENIESDIIDILSNFILTHGKPVSVNVGNEKNKGYIEDLCKKLNIKVSVKNSDFTANLLMNLMNSMDMF